MCLIKRSLLIRKNSFLCTKHYMNNLFVRAEPFETIMKRSSFLKKSCNSSNIDYYCLEKNRIEKKILNDEV